MVNFTNPGVLGDASYFRRFYEVSNKLLTLSGIFMSMEPEIDFVNAVFVVI